MTLQGIETPAGLETAETCRECENQAHASTTKPPHARQVAPEAPGAMRGESLKRPQQPGRRQPATCQAACRPLVRCVSHIAGLESLCVDKLRHVPASPRSCAPCICALRQTSSERRPGLPGAQHVKGPVAPQAAPERADRRASGICKEACARGHAHSGSPRPKPLFGQAATCWVSKSSCPYSPALSSLMRSSVLRSPQRALAAAATKSPPMCGAALRKGRCRGCCYKLHVTIDYLPGARRCNNCSHTLHAACTPNTHTHTFSKHIGCRPALCT